MANLVMVMMAMMTMMSTTSAVHSVSGIPPAAACPPASHHEDDDGFHDNNLERRTGTPTAKSQKIKGINLLHIGMWVDSQPHHYP